MTTLEKKRRKRGANPDVNDDPWKPTHEELEVAKYLIRKLPSKEGKLSGMIVQVFIAIEAVELLMVSPWARVTPSISESKSAKPVLFTTQASVEAYMSTMLQKQIFHRAIRVKKKPSNKSREESKSTKTKSKKLTDGKGDQVRDPNESVRTTPSETSDQTVSTTKTDSNSNSTSNTKSSNSSNKPIRIEMADEQVFVLNDPQSVYVWIYEPPPGLINWLAGAALIIGIILCCLFPIWPSELRLVAYYSTIAVSGSLGVLLGLALIRLCLFIFIWVLTLGRYNLWLFPNYFEDCGFLASFKPIYSICETSSKDAVDGPKLKKDKSKSLTKPSTTPATLTSSLPGPALESSTNSKTKVGKQD